MNPDWANCTNSTPCLLRSFINSFIILDFFHLIYSLHPKKK